MSSHSLPDHLSESSLKIHYYNDEGKEDILSKAGESRTQGALL